MKSIVSVTLMALLCLSGSVITSEAFVTSPHIPRSANSKITTLSTEPPAPRPGSDFIGALSPTLLKGRKDVSSEERGSDSVNSLIGIDRGLYLFALVLAINVWFFSVPVEFRRTRFCNEADSAAYPTKCMTGKQFREGIIDYYKNGGGIKFDFSIEGKE